MLFRSNFLLGGARPWGRHSVRAGHWLADQRPKNRWDRQKSCQPTAHMEERPIIQELVIKLGTCLDSFFLLPDRVD